MTTRVDAGQRVVVYDESASVHSLAHLGLAVRAASGAPVSVEPYHGLVQYDRGGLVATAVGAFNASEAGLYQVSSSAAGSGALALGPDLVDIAVDGTVRGGVIAAVTLLAALAILTAGRIGPRYSSEQ